MTEAQRTELDREQRLRDKAALGARPWAQADQIGSDMPAGVTSDNSWLYDEETGLPG